MMSCWKASVRPLFDVWVDSTKSFENGCDGEIQPEDGSKDLRTAHAHLHAVVDIGTVVV